MIAVTVDSDEESVGDKDSESHPSKNEGWGTAGLSRPLRKSTKTGKMAYTRVYAKKRHREGTCNAKQKSS